VVSPHDREAELAAEVVGRALRALEPDEEDRVAEHLRDCAPCRALLAETHETMAALAHALPPVEPPPALRTRILSAAAAEPDPPTTRRAPDPVPPPDDGPTPTRPTPVVPDVQGVPTMPGAPSPVPRRRTAAVLALAAVVAAIVVFAARGAVTPAPDDPRAAVAARAQQVVASAQARDPSVRSASLIEPGNGTVAGVVLDDGSGPRMVPLAMPPIGSGRTYMLWRVSGASATPVATLDTTGALTPMPVQAPASPTPPPGSRSAYALSVERVGTVPARPSGVVASGPLV
jgi:anti-sigma factor RsiW